MRNKSTSIFAFSFLAVVVISILIVLLADEAVITIISTISTLIGIVGLLISFKLDRNISEASFVFELYKTFRENENIKNISNKLEAYFLGQEVSITENDRSDIVDYLTFFEMLGSMEQRGAVSVQSIDPLFGYDFFIAVNNPIVREMEFERFNEYYVQTTALLKKWKKYREKHGLPMPLSVLSERKTDYVKSDT